MRLTETFTKEFYNSEKKLLIYGAGNYGEIALGGLKEIGLTPDYFVDKNHAGELYHQIPVISPQEINRFSQDVFLVASLNYFGEIVATLIKNEVEIFYDIEYLIEICPDEFLNEYTLDEKRNIDKYKNVINNYNKDELIVGHVEVVLTEKCTLRCKDCAKLMQYYEKPENLEVNGIIQSFDKFLTTIDILLEMRLLGGEPFLVNDMDKLLLHYINNNKIKRITVYTNSTIIPNEKILRVLADKKVSVHMSDYGLVSRKVRELSDLFDRSNIKYYVHKYNDWKDLGGLNLRGYTDDALKKLYADCLMSKCYTFYRGILYLCPRAAHGERLGFFNNLMDEYIDYNNMSDPRINRKKLLKVINNTESLTACKYCNGSCVRSRSIPAAIQKTR